jgi:hypothetical protein
VRAPPPDEGVFVHEVGPFGRQDALLLHVEDYEPTAEDFDPSRETVVPVALDTLDRFTGSDQVFRLVVVLPYARFGAPVNGSETGFARGEHSDRFTGLIARRRRVNVRVARNGAFFASGPFVRHDGNTSSPLSSTTPSKRRPLFARPTLRACFRTFS